MASVNSCVRLAYQRRGDVDDVSEFLQTHLRHRELRHIEESCQVRLSYSPKVFGGVLGKGLGKKDSCVVHQQINSPETLNRGTYNMLGRFLNTNVAGHQFQIGSAVERYSGRNLPGVRNHAITLFDEPLHHLKADPARRTCDDSNPGSSGKCVLSPAARRSG